MARVKASEGIGWLLLSCEDCHEEPMIAKLVPDGVTSVILRIQCGCDETTDFKVKVTGDFMFPN